MNFLLFFALTLLFSCKTAFAHCSYNGHDYPDDPFNPVVGATLTCICSNGHWIQCEPNNNNNNNNPRPSTPTALSIRNQFSAKDFTFNLAAQSADSSGLGGTIRPLSVAQLPSLAGQGVSMTLFRLDPCGINLPHVHPRATEIIYVTKGSKLRVAFAEENSGRTLINDISVGQVTFFPQGLIHYQQNLGCDRAEYISALNSEDPGVVTISTRTFTLPKEALQVRIS